MKLKQLAIAATIATSLCAAQASATVITDIYDDAPDTMLAAVAILDSKGKVTGWTPSAAYLYSHNVLDNGYIAGTAILSATLDINLKDADNENEKVVLSYGLGINKETGTVTTVPSSPAGKNFNFVLTSSVADIFSSGMLSVSITANEGVFLFDKSTLNVTIADPVDEGPGTKIPEPASLGLMALALAGLAAMRRRRA